MLRVNPGIAVDGLIHYYDLNNIRCYPWDGTSLKINNLQNSAETLTAFILDTFKVERKRRFLRSSSNNTSRVAGDFKTKALSSFTIQFWLRARSDFFNSDYSSDYITVMSTIGLSSLGDTQELLFNNEALTYNDIPITYTDFSTIPAQDGPGTLKIFNFFISSSSKELSMEYKTDLGSTLTYSSSSLTLSATNEWNLITVSKNLNTLSIYKNLEVETFSLTPSFTSINLNGMYLYTNNYDINHLFVYDRALTDLEVFENFRNFKSMYEISDDVYVSNVGALSVRRRLASIKPSTETTIPSTWDVTLFTTNNNEPFAIFINGLDPYIQVDYGDGTSPVIYDSTGNKVKTYVSPGTYTLKISGSFSDGGGLRFNSNAQYYANNIVNVSVIPPIPGFTNFTDLLGGTSITSLPPGLFDYNPWGLNFVRTFSSNLNLTSIPQDIFKKCTSANTFQYAFYNCKNLQSIPVNLFASNTAVTNFDSTFLGCTGITAVPGDVFKNNILVNNFSRVFNEVKLTTTQYGNILSELYLNMNNRPSFVTFGANISEYDEVGDALRDQIISAKSWVFNDNGITPGPKGIPLSSTNTIQISDNTAFSGIYTKNFDTEYNLFYFLDNETGNKNLYFWNEQWVVENFATYADSVYAWPIADLGDSTIPSKNYYNAADGTYTPFTVSAIS